MPKKPALAPELVHEFVNEAHGNFGRVKELLEQEPALLNAAWDWGGGDWETGLGAAAHMGKRDIALHLLALGARMDIFAAAMLGRLDVVAAVLAAQPEAAGAPAAARHLAHVTRQEGRERGRRGGQAPAGARRAALTRGLSRGASRQDGV